MLQPSLPVLPYDDKAAEGQERARLTGEKRTPAFADGQIAVFPRSISRLCRTYGRSHKIDKRILEADHVEE